MNTVAVLAATLVAILPVVTLAVIAWFAVTSEAATVHSFDVPEGLQCEE